MDNSRPSRDRAKGRGSGREAQIDGWRRRESPGAGKGGEGLCTPGRARRGTNVSRARE